MVVQEQLTHFYTVGDIVRITEPFGPNPAGSIGIVYETYPDEEPEAPAVVSILLTNGHDIGSFTGAEQAESLTWLGHTKLAYTYTSPRQLMADYRVGMFEQVLAEGRAVAGNVLVASVSDQ